uniref:Uncharacterized protein n=1 Tax=Chromera velia CCMP2878 TaxID=1169474 RepID=A0A0G4GUS3_9ALVE|eukprot:Cvel_23471.t1-p1 / transcript=Cvel_23471.t1 / gene=Cvel_23471 / organism=Chromera_velia_CCMP2878 / gene_product=hypothetical protein / transcript_product=hypothetical protein / location=Cvel_scaffold2422:2348-11055(+) / protein_length=1357 / sequence_SO=supercontig / SO=protein_coding / is_pseudo=false
MVLLIDLVSQFLPDDPITSDNFQESLRFSVENLDSSVHTFQDTDEGQVTRELDGILSKLSLHSKSGLCHRMGAAARQLLESKETPEEDESLRYSLLRFLLRVSDAPLLLNEGEVLASLEREAAETEEERRRNPETIEAEVQRGEAAAALEEIQRMAAAEENLFQQEARLQREETRRRRERRRFARLEGGGGETEGEGSEETLTSSSSDTEQARKREVRQWREDREGKENKNIGRDAHDADDAEDNAEALRGCLPGLIEHEEFEAKRQEVLETRAADKRLAQEAKRLGKLAEPGTQRRETSPKSRVLLPSPLRTALFPLGALPEGPLSSVVGAARQAEEDAENAIARRASRDQTSTPTAASSLSRACLRTALKSLQQNSSVRAPISVVCVPELWLVSECLQNLRGLSTELFPADPESQTAARGEPLPVRTPHMSPSAVRSALLSLTASSGALEILRQEVDRTSVGGLLCGFTGGVRRLLVEWDRILSGLEMLLLSHTRRDKEWGEAEPLTLEDVQRLCTEMNPQGNLLPTLSFSVLKSLIPPPVPTLLFVLGLLESPLKQLVRLSGVMREAFGESEGVRDGGEGPVYLRLVAVLRREVRECRISGDGPGRRMFEHLWNLTVGPLNSAMASGCSQGGGGGCPWQSLVFSGNSADFGGDGRGVGTKTQVDPLMLKVRLARAAAGGEMEASRAASAGDGKHQGGAKIAFQPSMAPLSSNQLGDGMRRGILGQTTGVRVSLPPPSSSQMVPPLSAPEILWRGVFAFGWRETATLLGDARDVSVGTQGVMASISAEFLESSRVEEMAKRAVRSQLKASVTSVRNLKLPEAVAVVRAVAYLAVPIHLEELMSKAFRLSLQRQERGQTSSSSSSSSVLGAEAQAAGAAAGLSELLSDILGVSVRNRTEGGKDKDIAPPVCRAIASFHGLPSPSRILVASRLLGLAFAVSPPSSSSPSGSGQEVQGGVGRQGFLQGLELQLLPERDEGAGGKYGGKGDSPLTPFFPQKVMTSYSLALSRLLSARAALSVLHLHGSFRGGVERPRADRGRAPGEILRLEASDERGLSVLSARLLEALRGVERGAEGALYSRIAGLSLQLRTLQSRFLSLRRQLSSLVSAYLHSTLAASQAGWKALQTQMKVVEESGGVSPSAVFSAFVSAASLESTGEKEHWGPGALFAKKHVEVAALVNRGMLIDERAGEGVSEEGMEARELGPLGLFHLCSVSVESLLALPSALLWALESVSASLAAPLLDLAEGLVNEGGGREKEKEASVSAAASSLHSALLDGTAAAERIRRETVTHRRTLRQSLESLLEEGTDKGDTSGLFESRRGTPDSLLRSAIDVSSGPRLFLEALSMPGVAKKEMNKT